MKPRIDFSKPVQLRNGTRARIICSDFVGSRPVIAATMADNGMEGIRYYHSNGQAYADQESLVDLINVPAAQHHCRLWLVVNKHGLISTMYAPPSHPKCYIACKEINVTIMEGEGITQYEQST